ncbi:MAG: DUF1345 domain-containing protein [Humibacillus sp.]|nr:DUF1345 domain-containing protein [Humibacillus sp.]MDN5777701.1 DUF1345 domain-containing protein [Humibacillus sp.]
MHRVRVRLAIAVVVGVVVGFVVPLPSAGGVLPHLLVAFIATGLAFAGPLLTHVTHSDTASTRQHVDGEDPGARTSDFIIIVVGLLALCGVAVMLVGAGGDRTAQLVDAVIGVVAVAVGWLCVHTIYTLRYARIYYSSDLPCIDFNQTEPPRYSDFAYFSFNLGMTYQVSDTALRSSDIRRVVFGHCVLAYVFGTVVVASAINLVVGISTTGS